MNNKVVLITGASSGIGLATALAMLEAGFKVYATARRLESLAELAAKGCHTLALDVTDESSIITAVKKIEAAHGSIDILVNNAGYGEMGAVEEVRLAAWRQQFETNVFGLVRLTQLVLPGMRSKGSGLIINIGSGGGEFTFPLGAAYHASKYALESISDALRFEVKSFGIKVVLIQPGPVKTPLSVATISSIKVELSSPYAPIMDSFRKMSEASYKSGRGYISPEKVAGIILKAATARRPKARYKVGVVAGTMSFLRRTLSDHSWDVMLGRMYRSTTVGQNTSVSKR